jgi:hypothetical protein
LSSIRLSCEEIVKKRLRDYLELEDEICLDLIPPYLLTENGEKPTREGGRSPVFPNQIPA